MTCTCIATMSGMDELFISGIRIDWNLATDGVCENSGHPRGRDDTVPSTHPDSYVSSIPALRSLNELEFDNPITMFTGENGTGKSTLLEAIAQAYGFNPEGGTRNYRFSTYDDVSNLSNRITLIRRRGYSRSGYFFRAESFFNVATQARAYDRSGELFHLHEQSHGESFLAFMRAFDRPGLYIMDEPEAALSPQRQLSLLVMLHRMVAEGSQFIIATHSPILLGFPGASLLTLDDGRLHPCALEDTASYSIMATFINHRDSLFHHLFG